MNNGALVMLRRAYKARGKGKNVAIHPLYENILLDTSENSLFLCNEFVQTSAH